MASYAHSDHIHLIPTCTNTIDNTILLRNVNRDPYGTCTNTAIMGNVNPYASLARSDHIHFLDTRTNTLIGCNSFLNTHTGVVGPVGPVGPVGIVDPIGYIRVGDSTRSVHNDSTSKSQSQVEKEKLKESIRLELQKEYEQKLEQLKEKYEQSKDFLECCVCMHFMIPEEAVLKCNHFVCKGCVSKLSNGKCPVCRQCIEYK